MSGSNTPLRDLWQAPLKALRPVDVARSTDGVHMNRKHDPDSIAVSAASFTGNNDGNAVVFLIESAYRG